MSLGGGPSDSLDAAVAGSVADGVTYAVAAGNEDADACGSSPAAEPSAITVGSTTPTDSRSSFSNYGTCVDLFAPGSGITSTWNTSNTATNTISGTSMASPHVAGAAAVYLESDPTATPAEVTAALLGAATTGVVNDAGPGSPPHLLYSSEDPPIPCQSGVGVVVIHSGAGFTGDCVTLPVGSYASAAAFAPVADDDVSSIEVGFGVEATLYEDAGFAGSTLVRGSDDGDLADDAFDDRTSSIEVSRPRPPNDDFADAEVLAGASGSTTGTNVEATEEPGEPVHAGVGGGTSVWYSWTAPTDESVAIDTFGSDYDTVLAVYTGSSVGGLSEVASNDDAGSLQSRVGFASDAGTTYHIAVDGYSGDQGTIALHWAVAGPPPNDDFADAEVLAGGVSGEGATEGTNVDATEEPGEPVHAGVGGGRSVWYSYTAPESDVLVVDTLGSGFDTVLAVYTGSSVDGLTEVASNDDATGLQSRVEIDASAATTYRIAVDGYAGAQGPIELHWYLGGPSFSDVPETHPFFEDVEWMAEQGISNGYADGTYRPSAVVTRQAMSAFMYRLADPATFIVPEVPSFSDVGNDHPFYDEIEWMAASGVSTGYADGTYGPSANVSRQAMSAFMYRLAGEPAFTAPGSASFPDVPAAHPFFEEIEWMAAEGITGGYSDGTFKPAAAVSRQAMSAFMHRLADGPGVGI